MNPKIQRDDLIQDIRELTDILENAPEMAVRSYAHFNKAIKP